MLKLLKKEFTSLLNLKKWQKLLISGDLLSFEECIYEMIMELYDKICKAIILYISKTQRFLKKQKSLAKKYGLKKLQLRPCNIYLRTGSKITIESYYGRVADLSYKGSRHLVHIFWHIRARSSPMLQSITTLLSVICPSYAIAKWLLGYVGTDCSFERVRDTSLALSEQVKQNRHCIQLANGETLAGKRVVISIDGGRYRSRVYKDELTAKGNAKFDTDWKEPKMFVIQVIDEKGNIHTDHLPIYDSTFGDDESFALLQQYLLALQIDRCKEVQFVADGAKWIWHRAKPMLLKLGVAPEKITETLDYYHASENLHKLKEYIDHPQKEKLFKKMKDALWQGNIKQLARLTKKAVSNVCLEKFTPFQYFKNNEKRIDYQGNRARKLVCGSGIIESGIRRIINLRFKAASSFWYPENVEKLILMRGIALSGRWDIMVKNTNQTN